MCAALRQVSPETEFILYGRERDRDLNAIQRMRWESITIPLRALKDKPDLIYSPGFAPAFVSSFPQVVTVHDLIGLALPSNQRAVSKFYWMVWLPAAVRRAKRIVASSQSTRRDIERFLGIPAERVSVVPLGADARFKRIDDARRIAPVLNRYGIGTPYFISVSSLEPRKNHLRLLEAYEKLRRNAVASFSLVIVGKPAGAEKKLYDFVEWKGLGAHVKFLGYVTHEDLICLYNGALGYVMISLYEGFGLPALEAMRCGLGGVVSNRSSLPEVTGDTALLVNPDLPEEIAGALSRFAGDQKLRQSLAAAAFKRSQEFSYEKAAQTMMTIFKDECKKK